MLFAQKQTQPSVQVQVVYIVKPSKGAQEHPIRAADRLIIQGALSYGSASEFFTLWRKQTQVF